MDEFLTYVQTIGKILSIGISLYAIIWDIICLVKVYVEKAKIAIYSSETVSSFSSYTISLVFVLYIA